MKTGISFITLACLLSACSKPAVKRSITQTKVIERTNTQIVYRDVNQIGNPNWQELLAFLLRDKTNEHPYVKGKFTCLGFAVELQNQARKAGIRSAIVQIDFGNSAHALNAFETSDHGIVYVEPQHDAIVFIEVGQKLLFVSINSLKADHIDTSGKPEDFWHNPTFTPYKGSLFNYAFFEYFSRRAQFYTDSARALEREIEQHNADVNAYNNQILNINPNALKKNGERFEPWRQNLNILHQELGKLSSENTDKPVHGIEVYWNN